MSFFKEYFRKGKSSKKGFTLVEMIATIAVMAILSTATVSVLFAVQSTTRHAADITAEQYTTTQIERFLRNEFQVAANVDVANFDGSAPSGATDAENREVMYYDADTNSVKFIRMNKAEADALVYTEVLSIDSVKQVNISIVPVSVSATDKDPYKLIYSIETEDYTYSGGIVLGNTFIGKDDSMSLWGPDPAKLVWTSDAAVLNNNSLCVTFISVVKRDSA